MAASVESKHNGTRPKSKRQTNKEDQYWISPELFEDPVTVFCPDNYTENNRNNQSDCSKQDRPEKVTWFGGSRDKCQSAPDQPIHRSQCRQAKQREQLL